MKLKIMTARTVTASTATPLWTSLGNAFRHTLQSLSAPLPAAEDVANAHDHIRRASRHWLLG
jgi:hypothetical protein